MTEHIEIVLATLVVHAISLNKNSSEELFLAKGKLVGFNIWFNI